MGVELYVFDTVKKGMYILDGGNDDYLHNVMGFNDVIWVEDLKKPYLYKEIWYDITLSYDNTGVMISNDVLNRKYKIERLINNIL